MSAPRPRVLLYAFHDAGRACLEALLADGYPVVGLFTHEPSEGELAWMRPPEAVANEAGVPVFTARNPNRRRWREQARALRPELLLSVMYRRLLGAELLALPRLGAYNLHPSLLPRYRGRCPVNWVLVEGARETGVTLHAMTAEADAGAIVEQRRLPIAADDTALTLHRRLVPLFVETLRAALPGLASGIAPRHPQDRAAVTVRGGRGRSDGAFDPAWSAVRIERLVRAVTWPYPGAFAVWEGRPFIVWRAEAVKASSGPPGTLRGEGTALRLRCGDGDLLLWEWQVGWEPDSRAAEMLTASVEADDARLAAGAPSLLDGDEPRSAR